MASVSSSRRKKGHRTPAAQIPGKVDRVCQEFMAADIPLTKLAVATKAGISRTSLDKHAKQTYEKWEQEDLKKRGFLTKEAADRLDAAERRRRQEEEKAEWLRRIDELSEVVLAITANVQAYAPHLVDRILQPLERIHRP